MAETLKRRIGLPLLTAYGVGVMVGAGIYVSIRAMLLIGAAVVRGAILLPVAAVGVFASASLMPVYSRVTLSLKPSKRQLQVAPFRRWVRISRPDVGQLIWRRSRPSEI